MEKEDIADEDDISDNVIDNISLIQQVYSIIHVSSFCLICFLYYTCIEFSVKGTLHSKLALDYFS